MRRENWVFVSFTIWLAALLSANLCEAQEPNADVNKIGGDVSPPKRLNRIDPHFTAEAQIARLQGTVVLFAVIGTDGKARQMRLLRSLGLGLDEQAIRAVAKWEFSPGEKGGQPVKVNLTINVNFRLSNREGKRATHPARVEFHNFPDASRPVLVSAVVPAPWREDDKATMTVTFDVDEHGNPNNIHIDKTSDDLWSTGVTAALTRWKFTPASKDGAPLVVSCTMDFVRGD